MKGRLPVNHHQQQQQQQQQQLTLTTRQSGSSDRITNQCHNNSSLQQRQEERRHMTSLTTAIGSDLDVFCSAKYGSECTDLNVDVGLPFVDWDLLEEQLRTALKLDETAALSSPRRTDRDAIRRRLATGSDGEYCYCGCGSGYVYGPDGSGYGGGGTQNYTRRFTGGRFASSTDARRKSTPSATHQHHHRRHHHGQLQQHRSAHHSGVTVDLEMCLINELYNRNVYGGDGNEDNHGGSSSTATSRQSDDRDRGRAATAIGNSNNDLSANDRRQQKHAVRRRTQQKVAEPIADASTDHGRANVDDNASSTYVADDSERSSEDFLSRQARLQIEAKLALAQVRPMARMQLQLEKQHRRKSPIADMVGIPWLGDVRQRLSRSVITHMSLPQLQVIVNDMYAQIETHNAELMQLLEERDDLHMAQDSMLVDIEDLTRRGHEYQEQRRTQMANEPAIN